MSRGKLHRFLRHLATDHGSVRRAFPKAALTQIEAAIAEGERHHRGQLRFAVEPALSLPHVLRGLTPRERALDVFGLLRIWDTAENSGVLVYLLLADRDVEIIADRGIHAHVGSHAWKAVCGRMEAAFRESRYAEAVECGIGEINALLALHYPRVGDERPNELSDKPVIL